MALIYASAVNKRMNSHHNAPRCKRSTVESPHCGLQDIMHGRQHSNEESGITDITDMTRSISLSKDVSARRKRSGSNLSSTSTLVSYSPTNQNNNKFFFQMSTSLLYSPTSSTKFSRSKPTRNSCSEIKRKTTVPNNSQSGIAMANTRKISTPVMMHSMVACEGNNCSPKEKAKSNMRKNLVKKRLIQEYGLDNTVDINIGGGPSSTNKIHFNSLDENDVFNDRRKSQSLDPDDWKRQVVALASGEEDNDDETNNGSGVCPRNNSERKKSAFQKMRNKLAKWRNVS